MEEAQEQQENSKVPPQLRKYVFKQGVSGNPGGRPRGSVSMKTFAQNYLLAMPEKDRIDFLNTLDPKTIWEMSEGKAKQDMEASVKATVNVIVPETVAKSFNINGTNTETERGDTQQEQV